MSKPETNYESPKEERFRSKQFWELFPTYWVFLYLMVLTLGPGLSGEAPWQHWTVFLALAALLVADVLISVRHRREDLREQHYRSEIQASQERRIAHFQRAIDANLEFTQALLVTQIKAAQSLDEKGRSQGDLERILGLERRVRELRQELWSPFNSNRYITMDSTLLITGVSASLQAIQTWLQFRDSRRAAAEFVLRREEAPGESRIQAEAVALDAIVPADVMATMTERARRCWERYHSVLKGGFLPEEIDEATEALKKCICRELSRIKALEGRIPEGVLQTWWRQYCEPE